MNGRVNSPHCTLMSTTTPWPCSGAAGAGATSGNRLARAAPARRSHGGGERNRSMLRTSTPIRTAVTKISMSDSPGREWSRHGNAAETRAQVQVGVTRRTARRSSLLLMRLHSRSGDRFNGMDLLYLATVGAKSGQRRTNPVTRFDDGDGWVVAASAGGMAQHPGWHHNVVAHPD